LERGAVEQVKPDRVTLRFDCPTEPFLAVATNPEIGAPVLQNSPFYKDRTRIRLSREPVGQFLRALLRRIAGEMTVPE